MFDVLAYLFEEYISPQDCPDRNALQKRLASVGFEEEEIVEALDWLSEFANIDASPYAELQLDRDLPRLLHPFEAQRLSLEAQSFFYYLASSGTLDVAQRELLIDQLMQSRASLISVEAIKRVTLMLLWQQGDDLANLLLEELLLTDYQVSMH